jgi:ubiquinone/menaquinone biosynthesis C-methylase UbiE
VPVSEAARASGLEAERRWKGAAEVYARFRPGYPDALLDWLVAQAAVRPGDRVADVGCGTGIFTRLLAARGLAVVGVDPSRDMLARARAEGGPPYLRASASATGLATASVSLVSVAQAFHWFPLDEALAELTRVLQPGGHVAAVWNLRGQGAFMDEYDAVLRRFSSTYGVVESWEETLERLRAHPRARSARSAEFASGQRFDLEGLRGRAWSSSYVRHGVTDRAGFDEALARLFAAHARDGTLAFPYRSVALVFTLGAP